MTYGRWLFVLLTIVATSTVHAQGQLPSTTATANTEPSSVAETPAPETIDDKRESVSERLRVATRTLDTAKEAAGEKDAPPPERLQREVELLKQLEAVLAQIKSAKGHDESLHAELADLEGELETVRDVGPPGEKPYSFLLLDHLQDELAGCQARTDSLDATMANVEDGVARAKEQLAAKEQALRRAKEAITSTDANEQARQAAAAKLAELEARIAGEVVALKKQEQANEQLSNQIHATRVQLLQETIRWVQQDALFSPGDLQDQMVEIDKRESDLKNALRTAEVNLRYAETEWLRAKQQLDGDSERALALVEQVDALQIDRRLHQQQVAQLNVRLQRLGADRDLWNRRYKVITAQAQPDELITWQEEAAQLREQLAREHRLAQLRIDELRQEMAVREKKLHAASDDAAPARRWIKEQSEKLGDLAQLHDANIVAIEATRRLSEKLESEIQGDVKTWTISEWLEGAKHYVAQVWNTELLTIDEQPLTIGKVLLGCLLLAFGFIASRMISRMFGRRLQQGRFRMNESGAAALQTLSFYAILVLSTLTVLRFVNVPLSMFTFLGGAVAIGVGFGSQNIVNNFISGLVLLAERPIKVGDLIQIDQLYGTVEHIGARSTRIRTGGNLDIIVPNSAFLENNVVNLTLGDDKLRTQVNVGVAYGSTTRDVTKLLKRAADDHGRVLPRPDPFVWFAEFGDNSLMFELHFWVKVRTVAERKSIESDIRHRIDQLFRNAGITIAFPQRDVHVNADTPISVQMLPIADPIEAPGKPVSNAA